jgi:hypothetical protein
MKSRREDGMVAIWGALTFLFIVGAVAFAADTSGFFKSARADQTTADLACLAGVQELPSQPINALNYAEANARTNFPRIASGTVSNAANQRTITFGGHQVVISTNWTGDPKKMRVQVTSAEPRTFSRIWGSADVPVRQEAICESIPALGGPGVMPIYGLPGGFSGDLFDCAEKITGNCGAIDSGSGGNAWRDALDDGIDAQFEKHHGNWTSPDADTGRVGTVCSPPSFANPCNAADTEPGDMSGPFNQGMANRLSRIAGADCVQGGDFNCDSLSQVIHGGATPPAIPTLASAFGGTPPSWWEPSIYGAYGTYSASHYYYDGDIEKCDSPRLATVPIMNFDPPPPNPPSGIPNNWDIGGPRGTLGGPGRKVMKIVGFYTIYIREPDNRSDVGNGNGNGLNQIVADVVWFGPNATCDGNPVQFHGGPPVPGSVKLVDG